MYIIVSVCHAIQPPLHWFKSVGHYVDFVFLLLSMAVTSNNAVLMYLGSIGENSLLYNCEEMKPNAYIMNMHEFRI